MGCSDRGYSGQAIGGSRDDPPGGQQVRQRTPWGELGLWY
jgi:hypothetical protein